MRSGEAGGAEKGRASSNPKTEMWRSAKGRRRALTEMKQNSDALERMQDLQRQFLKLSLLEELDHQKAANLVVRMKMAAIAAEKVLTSDDAWRVVKRVEELEPLLDGLRKKPAAVQAVGGPPAPAAATSAARLTKEELAEADRESSEIESLAKEAREK